MSDKKEKKDELYTYIFHACNWGLSEAQLDEIEQIVNTKLKEEVERLRWMIDYASNAPDKDSVCSILVDALDGVSGADNVEEIRGERENFRSQLDKANKEIVELTQGAEDAKGCSAGYWYRYGNKVAEAHVETQEELGKANKRIAEYEKFKVIIISVAEKMAFTVNPSEEIYDPIREALRSLGVGNE